MLDLDKIRSIQSLPHLSFEDSKLAIFTRLHKYEDALPLVLAELDRLRSELAVAQAAPVVEWRTVYLDGEKWYAAQPPEVCLLVGPDGWQMWMSVWAWVMKLNPMDSGPETGTAGKAACEAAYRRACGRPAPVAPQVVPLHQAYEGTTVCLHCGKPMPWPEMDRCPRDSRIHAIPPCAG